jgi:hypothetical protein
MTALEETQETVEYRAVMIDPVSLTILGFEIDGHFYLPRVRIPQFTRPAHQLSSAIQSTWGLDVLVLDVLMTDVESTRCVAAEVRDLGKKSEFKTVRLDQIPGSEVSEQERSILALLLEGKSEYALSRIGWIDEAMFWVQSATGRTLSSKKSFVQLNAGGGFALLCFRCDDGKRYWLKATGKPNLQEYSITACISTLCPTFLPKLVAVKEEWNAWLCEDAGEPWPHSPSVGALVGGIESLASLQVQTIDHVDMLLKAGAFDQRLANIRRHIDEVVGFLIGAMARQTSTKVEALSHTRLLEMGKVLDDTCSRMEELCIPDALIHNDLNSGNVLYDGARCVFTDWSEAAVGNPFLSFERFCLLGKQDPGELRRIYSKYWFRYVSEENIDNAYKFMPLLAMFAYLYGRGNWLKNTEAVNEQFESYARSLARHMSRAAENSVLLEALCR